MFCFCIFLRTKYFCKQTNQTFLILHMKKLSFLFFLIFLSKIFSSLEIEIFINDQNDKRCSISFCDGSSLFPFDNFINAFSFTKSNLNKNNSVKFLLLNETNYITEEQLQLKLSQNEKGIYIMDFAFDQFIIQSNLSKPIAFIFETNKFSFIFLRKLVFKNVNFKFALTTNIDYNVLLSVEPNNNLLFLNCSFYIENKDRLKFNYLISTPNILSSNETILINITYCNFNQTIFNKGILDIQGKNTTVWIFNTVITSFNVQNTFIFYIFGSSNNISVISSSIVNSSKVLYISEYSSCILSFVSINTTSISNQSYIYLKSDNTLLIDSSDFYLLNLQKDSYFIYGEKSTFVKISKSIFKDISLNSSSLISLNYLQLLTIQTTNFMNCETFNSIALIYLNQTDSLIEKSYFKNFSSSFCKAGLFFIPQGKLFNITDSVFLDGFGDNFGIIYANTIEKVNILNSFFDNHTFGSVTLFFFGSFCEVLIDKIQVSLVFSKFSTDLTYGGTIIGLSANNISIKNSQIFYSGSIGPESIFYFSNSNRINIYNLTIYDSESLEQGLILVNSKNIFHMNCSYFLNIKGSEKIGIIFQENNEIFINNSSFLNFIAYNNAGGVFTLNLSNIMIIENCFVYNITGYSGSGIFLLNSNKFNAVNVTFDTLIIQNKALYGGIAFILVNNTINLENCKFYSSQAPNGAAALSIDTNNNIFVHSCIFFNLTMVGNTGGQGTGIYLYLSNNLTVIGSTFMNSTGYYGGGVFCTRQNYILIQSSIFYNLLSRNQSAGVGGWTQNIFVIENSSFINVSCTVSGGVFYIDLQNEANFSGILCYKSSSLASGGVFTIQSLNKIFIHDSIFTDSKAVLLGGLMYVNTKNEITIKNITSILSFSLEFGSFAYINANNNFTINDSKIMETQYMLDGGVFYIFQLNSVRIKNSIVWKIFSENKAANGGFIFSDSNNSIQVLDSSIANITDVNAGGVFYLNLGNDVVGENSTFINISTIFGGTLAYLSENNKLVLNKIVAKNLEAKNFGAIYLKQNNECEVNSSSFKEIITIRYDGGLFYLKFLNIVKFSSSIFENSSCGGYGGFAFMGISNTINIVAGNFLNIFTNTYGSFLYCDQYNLINLNSSEIANDFVSNMVVSNLIYLYGENSLFCYYFEVSRQGCKGDGCIFYLLNKNVVFLYNFKFSNLKDFSWFCVTTMKTGNIFNIGSGEILMNAHINDNNDYLFADSSNTYNSTNVSFVLTHMMNIIYSSMENNKFYFKKDLMHPSNEINVFIYSEVGNEEIKMEDIKFDFKINFFVVRLYSGNLHITRCYFSINLNGIVLFNSFDNSSFLIKKSSFINKFNYSFQILQTINTNIKLYSNFGYNMQNNNLGSVFKIKNSLLTIVLKNNIFIKAVNTNCLFLVDLKSIDKSNSTEKLNFLVSRNHFHLSQGLNGGVFKISSNSYTNLTFFQNIFKNNRAEFGGDLNIEATTLTIKNNSFINSKAKSLINNTQIITKGGSLYFSDPFDKFSIFLSQNLFYLNEADVGSAIFFDFPYNISFKLINNTFTKNDFYLSRVLIASKPTSITIIPNIYVNDLRLNRSLLTNIISGHKYSDCLFKIFFLDYFDNIIVQSDLNPSLTIYQTFPSIQTLNNTINYEFGEGYFCFNGPFTRNQYPISANFSYKILYGSSPSFIKVTFMFRDCQLGEKLSESYECIACESGTFSFITDFSSSFLCQSCIDSDPFTCNGGDQLIPKNDYWRLDKYSNNFIKCPKNDVCYQKNSNETIYTGACKKGYTGPLCNLCEIGYGKIDRLTCKTCDASNWQYFLFLNLKIAIKSIYFVYFIYVGFKMIVAITLRKLSKKSVIAIALLKILAIHFQILSFIPQIPIKLDSQIELAISLALGVFPEVSEIFMFDCYFQNYQMLFPFTYVILIMCPFYLLIVYLFSLTLIYYSESFRKLKKINPEISNLHLLCTMFFVIIYLSFVDIAKVYLEMFQCINIGDDKRVMMRLYNNMIIDCNQSSHLIWLFGFSLPALVILCVVPVLLLIKMTSNIKKKFIDKSKRKFLFGYFYFPYKKEMYFWDFITLIRRLLTLFIFLYFYDKLIQKKLFPLLLIYFLLAISFSLMLRYKPYKEKYSILNKVEGLSLAVLSANFLIINFYCSYYFYKNEDQGKISKLAVIILIIINGIFFIYWLKCYYSLYLRNKIRKIVHKLFAKSYLQDHVNAIKHFLITNEYFCDNNKKTTIDKKTKINIKLYFKAYEKLLEIIRYPNTTITSKYSVDNLIQNAIKNKKYLKIVTSERTKYLEDKKFTKIGNYKISNESVEFTINVSTLRKNYLEYFLKYFIVCTLKKNFQIEKCGIYLLESNLF